MRLILVSSAALALTGMASAQTLSVEPGQWEFESTTNMSMQMGDQSTPFPAQTETTTECITEEDAVLDPSELTQDGCTLSNMESDSTSMSFDMACEENGMAMTGSMSVDVTNGGKASTAKVNLSGSEPGMGTINIEMDMAGTHKGACTS